MVIIVVKNVKYWGIDGNCFWTAFFANEVDHEEP